MKFHKSLLVIAIATAFSSSATATEETLDKAKNDYEVIVVTQNRIQTLKEVPVAVSAFGEDFLEDFNVTNAVDLAKFTPGLNGGSTNDSFIDTIGIRGIVTSDFGVGGDASIGLYLDGVYQGRSGGSLSSFYDMSRVEVAKGPQGTLYGRNAASGAISMFTNEAIDATEGSFEFGLGSDNMQEITGVFNTTLSDDAFIRFAGYHLSEDSYIKNTEGGTLRDKEVNALRVNFSYEGWQDSLLKISVNYEDRDMDGGVYRSIWTQADSRKVSTDHGDDAQDTAEVFATTIDFEHDFGATTFSSQTAMKNYTWTYSEDVDGSVLPLSFYKQNDDTGYLSQEFRLTSNTGSDVFWFVGANFYQEKIDSSFANQYDEDAFCAQLPNLSSWEAPFASHPSQPANVFADCHELVVYGFGVPEEYAPTPGSGMIGKEEQVSAKGTYRGYGVYGDITWSITEQTNITLGGRFSYDEKEFALSLPTEQGVMGNMWLIGGHTDGQWISDSKDWSQFTPRLAINHELTNKVNIYANYSQGYKSGGFNTFALDIKDPTWELGLLPESTELASYDPETVNSYELGIKGDYFNDLVKFNLAAYYYDYDDLQGTFAETGGITIKNIGKAEGKGIEFELTYLPTENIRLFLASALQDSEVIEGTDLSGESIAGKKLAAPDVTLSFVGGYFWYLENDVDLTLQFSYNWQTKTFGSEFQGGNDVLEQDAYGLAGLQFVATGLDWQVSTYINNLTDEVYYSGALIDAGVNRFGIGRGINGGVKVKYNF
ncbi:TonB-dependent receptor [Thalassotalea castellviae]|uniref:TonB-dependent receptor n=1 Tax=Thalassotalea castellviae TaxID=3075612 RepID=A0ABU3A137_9GAMM|nr:TonB-dependent receptor [Thalassotalea sp. W431]MDT0603893.1 TonB-dependent receptor [Thalassotalea sp. W431]